MKHFLILLTAGCLLTAAKAQTAEDSVKAVINRLFLGMKGADAALVRSCFGDSVVFQTVARDKEGSILVRNESPKDFADFIGQQKKDALDERISFESVKIDGPLAIAWTPYNFFLNGQFSHCGVNSFQVVRFKDGWKIQYIIDTRRRQGCSQ
jgi:hypothetical protein